MKKGINKKKIIQWYIMLYPFCDILYTITNSMGLGVNFNQIIRGLGIILFFSCIHNKKMFLKTFLFMLIVLISFIYNYYIGMSGNIVSDIAVTLKIINNAVLLYGFCCLYKENKITFSEVADCLIFSSYIVIISILLSYFGLGISSYGDSGRAGVKGLFTIQSTITLYLLLILPLYYYKYRTVLNVRIILCTLALFSIGTKAGVFGGIGEYMALIVLDFRMERSISRIKRRKVLQYICIIFIGLTIGIYAMKNYIMYLIHLYISKDYYYSLEAFLLSNRNDHLNWIRTCLDWLNGGENNFAGTIWGYSYSGIAKIVQAAGHRFEALERDFHGIYYYYGVIVLLFIIAALLVIYWRAIKINISYKFKSIQAYLCVLILFVAFIYSFLGGHLLYEAMNQIPFWAIAAYVHNGIFKGGSDENRNLNIP